MAPFSCVLYGLYGNGIATNQLSKMVAGALHPGRPLANLYFASWSHQVILLAVNLANWLKVGQYTKVPHRVMFATQVYGTLLGAGLNYVVMTTIVTNKREILLNPEGSNIWSGSTLQSMNTEAITWALAKQFYGGRYLLVPLGLAVGLTLPILHWVLIKVFPPVKRWLINTAIIASYSGINYYGNTSWVWTSIAIGVFSQYWLRRRLPKIYNKVQVSHWSSVRWGVSNSYFYSFFCCLGASGKNVPFPTWWEIRLGIRIIVPRCRRKSSRVII